MVGDLCVCSSQFSLFFFFCFARERTGWTREQNTRTFFFWFPVASNKTFQRVKKKYPPTIDKIKKRSTRKQDRCNSEALQPRIASFIYCFTHTLLL